MYRRGIAILLIITAAISVALLGSQSDGSNTLGSSAGKTEANDAPLIVHEWGTFTSFSGSDGIPLKFRPLATNDLPAFVMSLADFHGMSFRKRSLTAFQRMETPVTYFYTPIERDVSVRVDFPTGLLTEFYPPPRKLTPERDTFARYRQANYDPKTAAPEVEVKDSLLDWGKIHLIPPSKLAAQVDDKSLSEQIGRHVERTMVPDSSHHPHYEFARNTDSAIVQLSLERPPTATALVPATDYFEKFLFYRGVSNFESQVTVAATGDDRFVITGEDKVTSMFLVAVEEESIRFNSLGTLQADCPLDTKLSKRTSTIEELSTAVVHSLVAEGLYEKEAQAMVDTWSSSWFKEPGTRLFYVLPQEKTDQLLPLQVTPEPQESVRVMVGRLEVMTPEQELQTEQLILSRVASDAKSADGAEQWTRDAAHLKTFGRWAEPSLARVAETSSNDAVKAESKRLLATFGRTPHAAAEQHAQ